MAKRKKFKKRAANPAKKVIAGMLVAVLALLLLWSGWSIAAASKSVSAQELFAEVFYKTQEEVGIEQDGINLFNKHSFEKNEDLDLYVAEAVSLQKDTTYCITVHAESLEIDIEMTMGFILSKTPELDIEAPYELLYSADYHYIPILASMPVPFKLNTSNYSEYSYLIIFSASSDLDFNLKIEKGEEPTEYSRYAQKPEKIVFYDYKKALKAQFLGEDVGEGNGEESGPTALINNTYVDGLYINPYATSALLSISTGEEVGIALGEDGYIGFYDIGFSDILFLSKGDGSNQEIFVLWSSKAAGFIEEIGTTIEVAGNQPALFGNLLDLIDSEEEFIKISDYSLWGGKEVFDTLFSSTPWS